MMNLEQISPNALDGRSRHFIQVVFVPNQPLSCVVKPSFRFIPLHRSNGATPRACDSIPVVCISATRKARCRKVRRPISAFCSLFGVLKLSFNILLSVWNILLIPNGSGRLRVEENGVVNFTET